MMFLSGIAWPVVINIVLYVLAAILVIYLLLKMGIWFLKDKSPQKLYANLRGKDPITVSGVIDLEYDLPKTETVRLLFLNDEGEELKVIVDSGEQAAGEYGYPLHTTEYPNGIYKYRLVTGNQTSTRRIIIHNQP